MNAAIGILLAIAARERTGKGQYIDISMTDGMVGLLSIPLHILEKNIEFHNDRIPFSPTDMRAIMSMRLLTEDISLLVLWKTDSGRIYAMC